MPTQTITATNYDADRYARLLETLDKDGLKLTDNTGEVKKFGADVKYNYDPISKQLVVTVLHGLHFQDFHIFCEHLRNYIERQP